MHSHGTYTFTDNNTVHSRYVDHFIFEDNVLTYYRPSVHKVECRYYLTSPGSAAVFNSFYKNELSWWIFIMISILVDGSIFATFHSVISWNFKAKKKKPWLLRLIVKDINQITIYNFKKIIILNQHRRKKKEKNSNDDKSDIEIISSLWKFEVK